MRTIFTLLLGLCTILSSFAQDVNDRVRFIPQSQVPAAVIERQAELFPTNYVSEWQVQEMNGMQNAKNIRYIAKFEEDGRPGFSASYLLDGTMIFNSEFMPSEIIPAEIRLKVESEFKNFTIHNGQFITFYNPKREIYLLKLLNDINVQYAFYNTAGNKIPEDSLPPEMLLLMR